jgi:hypothetical protein
MTFPDIEDTEATPHRVPLPRRFIMYDDFEKVVGIGVKWPDNRASVQWEVVEEESYPVGDVERAFIRQPVLFDDYDKWSAQHRYRLVQVD